MRTKRQSAEPRLARFLRMMAFRIAVAWLACIGWGQAAGNPEKRGLSLLSSSAQQTSQKTQNSATNDVPVLPRGKKLMLKDGDIQLVREYQMVGDRVRFYSVERSDWEEIPSSLVDWDLTKKMEVEEAKNDAAIVKKARAQELASEVASLDVDASIEVAPGLFLPPGEGLFEYDGKGVLLLAQAQTDVRLNKGQTVKQVLSPIKIFPTRHTVSLKGSRARFRLDNGQPEFYMRTADGRDPQLVLIHAKVNGDKRDIENLDKLFTIDEPAKRATLPMQEWHVARGVSRFTLSQLLQPGEYAIAEIIPGDTMSLYVWDFGLDREAAGPPSKPR